jgi:hypothetical protein
MILEGTQKASLPDGRRSGALTAALLLVGLVFFRFLDLTVCGRSLIVPEA